MFVQIEEKLNKLLYENSDEHYEKTGYIISNIFNTSYKFKMDKQLSISKKFPIYLRNPKLEEINILGLELNRKIKQILFSLNDLELILDYKNLKEYLEYKYFDTFFDHQIIEIICDYTYINKQNNEFLEIIKDMQNIIFIAEFITEYYLKDLIIIEVKSWNKIDKSLADYYGQEELDPIETADYRIYFLENYLNLFNKINFKLEHNGISINDKIHFHFHDLIKNINNYYYNEVVKVLAQPITIDDFLENKADEFSFHFLIETLNGSKLSSARMICLNYIIILEFMLTKQKLLKTDKGIKKQFCDNIIECYKHLNYKISEKELKNIYQYRSCIFHGNFEKAIENLNEIMKFSYFKKNIFINKCKYSYRECCISDYEEILNERLNEIFTNVYKLYCHDKKFVEDIKNSKYN